MFIIGHRGAAGLAPENSLLAIETAIKNRVDAVECDIRTTKDGRLVLCHDETFLRIAGDKRKVSETTLEQIKKITTKSGQKIPTIEQALKTAKKTPLVIEGKASGWAEPLAKVLKKHTGPKPLVISTNHRELFLFSGLMPKIPTFVVGFNHSVEIISTAKSLNFTGVSLETSLYNLFIYRYAVKNNLQLITSPINEKWRIRLFHFFYPKAMITTDFPNYVKHHNLRRFNLRTKRLRKKRK